jgi:secreted trypsin-like serine protease
MLVRIPRYGRFMWCSGTLVHPRVFLTAGHCTVDLESEGVDTIWVNFDQNANNHNALRLVDRAITHPDYDWGPTSNPHDVGALVLAEPVTDIAPAELPAEGFLDGLRAAGELRQGANTAKFTLVGYGGLLSWPPPEIQYADRRQQSVSEYRALLRFWLRMSQNQATGDGGTCYGDSGGPAFWTEPDGREILVGVTSWGDVPCVAAAFNYRVDKATTLDFIDDVIGSLAP